MVAVVMCTYNGEKFVGEQIESLINQTKVPDCIFISDDKSTDSTVEILNRYAEKYPDLIKVNVNEKNLGYRKNFESVFTRAKDYDIIFFCDQDDVWKSHKLEFICNEMDKNGYDLFFSNAEAVDANLNHIGTAFDEFFPGKKKNLFKKAPVKCLGFGSTVTGCTMAVRNTMFNYCVPFVDDYVHDEWISAIVSCIGKVGYTDECLVLYRQHENNVIGMNRKKDLDEVVKEAPKVDKPEGKAEKKSLRKKLLYVGSKESYERELEYLDFMEGRVRFINYVDRYNALAERIASIAPKAVSKIPHKVNGLKFLESIRESFGRNLFYKIWFFMSNIVRYVKLNIPLKHAFRCIFICKH